MDLRQTEEWFWDAEPRKLMALLGEARRMEREGMIARAIVAAHIQSGGDPDELREPVEQGPVRVDPWYF